MKIFQGKRSHLMGHGLGNSLFRFEPVLPLCKEKRRSRNQSDS